MKFAFLIFLLVSCSSPSLQTSQETEKLVELTEVSPDRETALTKQNFFHLIQIYELRPFLYTYRINVEANVPARSHPVLTLNTKYASSPHKILAQWLHQEFHWWANSKPSHVRKAMQELKEIYPQIPHAKTETDKLSYLHFIINSLEYQALTHLLGQKEAKTIIKEMVEEEKHYQWVYETVLEQDLRIKKILMKNQLLPAPLA